MMKAVLVSALVVVAGGAQAQRVSKVDGPRLMSLCSAHDVGQCDGYLAGFADAIAMQHESSAKGKPIACVPVAVTTAQMREVVVKYLRNNPQSREERGADLTARAFAAAFPCHP